MAVNGCPICLVKQRRIDESKKAICRGSFRSAEELVGNIEEFVTHLNMPAFRVDSHRLFDAQKDQKNISTYSWDVTLDAEINPGHLLLQNSWFSREGSDSGEGNAVIRTCIQIGAVKLSRHGTKFTLAILPRRVHHSRLGS